MFSPTSILRSSILLLELYLILGSYMYSKQLYLILGSYIHVFKTIFDQLGPLDNTSTGCKLKGGGIAIYLLCSPAMPSNRD